MAKESITPEENVLLWQTQTDVARPQIWTKGWQSGRCSM